MLLFGKFILFISYGTLICMLLFGKFILFLSYGTLICMLLFGKFIFFFLMELLFVCCCLLNYLFEIYFISFLWNSYLYVAVW